MFTKMLFFYAEKPEKVYQGVRVKWTVKDMLKFYREQAASGARLKTVTAPPPPPPIQKS